MTRRVLKVVVTGDTADLSKSLKQAGHSVEEFGDSAGKAGGKFKTAGVAAAGFMAGIAGSQLVDFGKDLFATGQRLDTMAKKAETVFEDSLPMIQKWSRENAHSMGLTRSALTGLSANFADLLKPMGFTAQQSAELSQEAIGLSGALAAWSGGTRTAAEVTEILTKAMLGQREQLKSLGVSISAADVATRLLENGTNDLTGAALEQAKAIATLELITEKSTDAQTAWNSESSKGIRTTNELRAKFAEVQEQLATKLYPIFLAVGVWLVDVGIPKFEQITRAVRDWFRESEDGQATLELLRNAAVNFGNAVETAFNQLKPLIGGIRDLIELAGGLDRVSGALKAVTAGGGVLPGLGPLLGRAQGKEFGGPVRKGQPYIVGERRAELFVPDVNGTIMPRVPSAGSPMTGGGGGTTIIVQGSVITERELFDVMRRAERRGVS